MLEIARKMNLQLFADGDPASDPAPGEQQAASTPDGAGEQPETTFTQAQLDKIVAERLSRQEKKLLDFSALGYADRTAAEAALKAAKERDEKDKSELEKERLARGKVESDLTAAQTRAIKAEARAQAAALGVPVAQLAYVVKLAALDGVSIGDDGDPDEAAIKSAVEKVLSDIPALKGGVTSGGANPPPGGKKDPFEEGFDNG